MLTIRFQRVGRTNQPAFRIVATESGRAAKAGKVVEILGSYNPLTKEFSIQKDRVLERISHGAQPSGSVKNLLITKGIIEGKKINVLPKHTAPKKEEPVAEAPKAAAPVAAAPVAEEVAAPVPEPVVEAEVEAPAAEEAAPEVAETPAEEPAA